MRFSTLSLGSAVLFSSLAVFAGCSSAPADAGDQSGAAATAGDLQTAKDVVSLLGGDDGKCKSCHGVTEAKVKAWGQALQDTDAKCFAPASLTDMQRIDCLRQTPGDATSPFNPHRLGLYAAGVPTQQFKTAFAKAFPADQGTSEYQAFATKTLMPKAGTPMTEAEFAKVKGWVLAGMPSLHDAFAPPPPTTGNCTPSTTPELAQHIQDMKTQGWAAKLADASTPMFGCADLGNPAACFGSTPDAPFTAPANVDESLKQLFSQDLASHYWVRSSADGRYVGMGMNDSAKVIDLQNPDSPIDVAADYDPFFLPSNDGFAFAGSQQGGAIVLCKQSLLADTSHSATPHVSLTESKCASMSQNVYMSIGTALDGARYFMTFGSHANDDGGNDITSQLGAGFGPNAATALTPMVNNGQSYKAQPGIVMKLPNEGDMMMSPSSQIAATRFGDDTHSFGYHLRFLKPSFSASGQLSVDTPAAATICMPGQKAGFSFDERFMVTHQYVDTTQPDQAQLPAGSSNIMMADLATGKIVRITNVQAGQFALYPHFRADGWLYFLVRDMNANKEYVVASDAAIRAEAANP
jgi:hypothetical protein